MDLAIDRTEPHELRGPGPPAARAGKYLAVLRMSVANNLAYAGEVVLRSLFLVVLVYVFVQLWQTTYGVTRQATIGGFSISQMVWYFAFAEAIILSAPRLAGQIDLDVKSGDLAYKLNKPYSYIGYLAADYTGERLVRFVLNLGIAVLLCLLMVGPIVFDGVGLLATGLLVAGAWAIDFLAVCVIGLLSFWIEDTYAFNLIYSRLLLLLGGTMLPLSVFPDWARSIAQALPFGYIVYGPAHSFVQFDGGFFGDMLLRQAVTVVVMGALAGLVFRAGSRRVNINGG
ncbi:MAG: ABC transporter permease [Chloroflexia bacterium]